MLDAAFVILRELAELLLILMAVQGCLKQAGRPELLGAAVFAVVAGGLLGWSAMALLVDREQGAWAEAVVSVLLGAATLWIASSMLSSGQAIQERVEDALSTLLDSRSAVVAVVAYCALAGFRESMEVFIFLRSTATTHHPDDIAMGVGLGLLMAVLAGAAFRSLWGQLRLLTIYRVSTVLLCFVSVKLILGGLVSLLALLDPGGHVATQLLFDDPSTVTVVAFVLTLWPSWVLFRRWWRESKT